MNNVQNCDVLKRLEDILESFLQPDYKQKHSIYFEKLIKHLSQQNVQEYLTAPFFINWVEKCCSMILTDYNSVHPQVIAFCYNITALILANEWLIVGLKRNCTLDKLIEVIELNKQYFNPSIKFGAIQFIKKATKYSMGCATITSKGLWRYVLSFLFEDPTVYIAREASEFLFDFLCIALTKSKDEAIVGEIFKEIVEPIHKNVCTPADASILVTVDDAEKWKKVETSVDLLCYILERLVESPQKIQFLKYCDDGDNTIEMALCKLTDYTLQTRYIKKVFKCLITRNFANLLETEWNGTDQMLPEQFSKFGINFYNIVRFSIRAPSDVFLHCMQYNFVLWHKLGNRAPDDVILEDELICFSQMLLIFHVIPLLHHTLIDKKLNEVEDDPFSQQFLLKLFKIQSEHAVRIVYAVRDSIQNESNTGVVALKSIFSIQKLMQREEAILLFQTLMQVLRAVCEALTDETKIHKCSLTERENLYYTILVGMESLIQQYQITWRESMESICLFNLMVVLLEQNLSVRICVQTLKVMQISIELFMAPNMALLIDNLTGSSLSYLGPLIVKRVHDPAWEVRDSTLELVHAITHISRIKFQAFQKFLIECNLFQIIFDMSKHDTEAYVRASAFKSLSSLVTVDQIWENLSASSELFDHLFDVMYNENEAIVRMQAVVTMAKIYEKRKIPVEYEDKLYSIFAYLALSDLHWEVNISALFFWKLEIFRRCTDQGMIDGTFPTVTFSKEHKKIVQLTPKEINLRITKIINELSAKGCLAVLYKCLTEENDLSVARKAGMIIKCFQSRIQKYDFEPSFKFQTNSINEEEIPTLKEDLVIEEMEKKNAEEIIENILEDRDIDCLVSACDQLLKLNGDKNATNILDSQHYKKFAHLHTTDFLNILKTNKIDEIIESREKWVEYNETFESFLDDMWYAFIPSTECNVADCY